MVLDNAVNGADAALAANDDERLLLHALRIDTMNGMAGMVAHQLRNHLLVIAGDAALGQRERGSDKDQRFGKILGEVDECARLIEQLLDMARPAESAPQRVDLTQACDQFALRFRGMLPASVHLALDLSTVPVPVELDPAGLEHALLNLVLNARQAMPDGGTVSLEVRAANGAGEVTVRDTGTGIPPALHGMVFKPWFTTKPRGQGTGLGLAAVELFARASAGRVSVDSREGEGAAFSLSFPLAR